MRWFVCGLALTMLACGAANAQSAEEHRVGILREINSDGALVALALHCKHAPDAVNRLGDKLEALTMAHAKRKSVPLDAHTYHEAARDGFLHMREVLALSTTTDSTYQQQCLEVESRIADKMAQ